MVEKYIFCEILNRYSWFLKFISDDSMHVLHTLNKFISFKVLAKVRPSMRAIP